MNADWSWVHLLTVVAGLYALLTAVFLIRENRSPQSTFAWLFLMLVFPIGGLVVYTLFGRSWKAFSRKNQLYTLMEGTSLADRRTALLERQPGMLEALSKNGVGDYGRLGHLLWASARAPLTLANQLTILQNAREKYPRLLEDLRAASESIHLLYYEWASDAFTEEVGRVLAEKVASGEWFNTTGENLFEDRYFPTLKSDSATLPIQVVSAGPDSQWKVIRQSYLVMITLARRHVYLQSPFLIVDAGLADVMKAAAMTGIDVCVMIAPRGGEGQLAYRASKTCARDLAEAGVRVLLYQGAARRCSDTRSLSLR